MPAAIVAIPTRRIHARCPRCAGRLVQERDQHGSYLGCLMCGCTLEERVGPPLGEDDHERAAWWREHQ